MGAERRDGNRTDSRDIYDPSRGRSLFLIGLTALDAGALFTIPAVLEPVLAPLRPPALTFLPLGPSLSLESLRFIAMAAALSGGIQKYGAS